MNLTSYYKEINNCFMLQNPRISDEKVQIYDSIKIT